MPLRNMNSSPPLPEIGKRLAAGVVQKEALLKLLKAAAGQLQDVNQSAGASTTAAIRPCVEALVKPQYLKHRDKDVRLFAALCCSEALRVFAPEPPYSDPELKEIFELVVEIFHRLNEVQNPLFNRIVGILETLAKVKTCIVMLDLDLNNLVQTMFEVFFSTISPEHPQNVHTAMLDVMATLLEESEDIPQGLLDAVLVNFLEKRKERFPAAYGMAVTLVQRCADRLQPAVQRFLTTIMQNPQSVESKLGLDYHEVILEIYKAAPQMLVAVLPSMLEELVKDDVEKRLKAVTLLGTLFSLPEQHVDQEYRQLYLEYMKRFVDKSVDVRLKMVELSQIYLTTTSTTGQDHFAALRGRVLDHDDKVRYQAAKAVCAVAQARLKIVPVEVLKEVAERLRDKKVYVKRLILLELTKVYKEYCARLFEGNDVSEGLDWIPCRILRCCYDKDMEFRQQAIDILLEEELFPSKLPIEMRAKHWVLIASVMDENETQALASIFRIKCRIHQEMSKYLELRKKSKEEVEAIDLQSQLQLCFKAMATAFVDKSKGEEHLGKLHQLKDNNIFKALATLLNPTTSYAQSRACREDLLKRIGEKHPQHDFMKDLTTKISFTFFGEEHVKAILKQISDGRLDRKKENLLSAGMKLLVEASAQFPVLFEPYQEDLVKLLVEGGDLVKESVAHILSNVGSHMRSLPMDQSSPVSEALQKLALKGTRKQAKHAVLAIAAVSEDAGLKDLSVLYTKLVDSLGESDENLPTVFQSLGVIAQHSMPIFETREDDIIKTIVRIVFRRVSDDFTTLEKKEHAYDWNKPSWVCQLKIYGLKALVKSFLPFKDTPARPKLKGLLNVLQTLIPQGELTDDLAKQSTDVDKSHIRLAAGKAVLRLFRRYDNAIQSTMPELFALTLFVAQDPCLQVRQAFVKKVHQYLHVREKPLPNKFACAFALQSIDIDKENVQVSKHFLAEFVEASRREAHIKQAKVTASSTDGSSITLLPEYVLVYLTHVLAHHPDFPKDSDNPDVYDPFKTQIQSFLQALLHMDGEGKSDQGKKDGLDPLPLILAIFRTIKTSEDAVKSSKTELLYAASEIGIMVAKELGRKRIYSSDYPGVIPLPSYLYKAPGEAPVGQEPPEGQAATAQKVDGSHLPKCLSDDVPKPKPKAASAPKPVQTQPARGRKRTKPETPEEDAPELHERDDTTPAEKEQTSPKRARKERRKLSATEEVVTPAATEKSGKEPKAPTRSTPRKGAIKQSPPYTRKGGKEELVGRRIQVWWPMDKRFYSGQIKSYEEKKNQHRVLYNDGDEETLVLVNERWEFMDEALGASGSQEAPEQPDVVSLGTPLPLEHPKRTPELTGRGGKTGRGGRRTSPLTKSTGGSGRGKRKREVEETPEGKTDATQPAINSSGRRGKELSFPSTTPAGALDKEVGASGKGVELDGEDGAHEGGTEVERSAKTRRQSGLVGRGRKKAVTAASPEPVANGEPHDRSESVEAQLQTPDGGNSLNVRNAKEWEETDVPPTSTGEAAAQDAVTGEGDKVKQKEGDTELPSPGAAELQHARPTRRGGRGRGASKSPANGRSREAAQDGRPRRGRPKGSGKKVADVHEEGRKVAEGSRDEATEGRGNENDAEKPKDGERNAVEEMDEKGQTVKGKGEEGGEVTGDNEVNAPDEGEGEIALAVQGNGDDGDTVTGQGAAATEKDVEEGKDEEDGALKAKNEESVAADEIETVDGTGDVVDGRKDGNDEVRLKHAREEIQQREVGTASNGPSEAEDSREEAMAAVPAEHEAAPPSDAADGTVLQRKENEKVLEPKAVSGAGIDGEAVKEEDDSTSAMEEDNDEPLETVRSRRRKMR